MNYICLNGKMLPAAEPALLATNRGYRYGDGLFETMKVINGKILLSAFHFERLFAGLALLKFEIPKLFTNEKLSEEIMHLCKKNACEHLARVRVSVFRGNGGLYDEQKGLQYLVESWPLNEPVNTLNENGLLIDVFPDAKKSCDVFSNLKSANYLPYTMAALYAKENKVNDCLIFNTSNCIADSTIANVFIIRDGTIATPSLSEGCVNGVMRRYLLEKMRDAEYEINETPVSVNDLNSSDEIFLTNAIHGVRWVKQFRDKVYTNLKTAEIHARFIKTIFADSVSR